MTDDKTPLPSRLAAARSLVLTLGLGSFGGLLFAWLHLPLAWMVGAMATTAGAAVLRLPVRIPVFLRNAMMVVLGILLGSNFTPILLEAARAWAVPVAGLVGAVLVAMGLCRWSLRGYRAVDPVSAGLIAVPGGLTEMVILSGELGGNVPLVALVHSLRILLVVALIALVLKGLSVPILTTFPALGSGWGWSAHDALWLGLAGAAAPLAQRLRFPTAFLLGPLLVSAGAHSGGLTAVAPPPLAVVAAQVVVGAAIGCRFAGIRRELLLWAGVLALHVTLITLVVAAAAAALVAFLTSRPFLAVMLAYAPGGVAEMSLAALALQVDVAFVTAHHLIRILLVLFIGQTFRFRKRRWISKASGEGAEGRPEPASADCRRL